MSGPGEERSIVDRAQDTAGNVGRKVLGVGLGILAFLALTLVAAAIFAIVGVGIISGVLGVAAFVGGIFAAKKVYETVSEQPKVSAPKKEPQPPTTESFDEDIHQNENQNEHQKTNVNVSQIETKASRSTDLTSFPTSHAGPQSENAKTS
ncbi:MAG: YrzE family protein [Clostridiales bacterium]|nr:YrzE family protein [Clostridiales bacterium]